MILFFLFSFPLLLSVLDVPFVRQSGNFCGPASLSAVLGYYGVRVDQEEIAKVTYSPRLKGALITDLQRYAERLGFKTELRQGSTEDIKRYVDGSVPVIVLVDLGRLFESVPHYMVVVGYQRGHFVVHTGYESNKKFQERALDSMWQRMGRVMLIIYPSDRDN